MWPWEVAVSYPYTREYSVAASENSMLATELLTLSSLPATQRMTSIASAMLLVKAIEMRGQELGQ
jgi:hypothetical protein